MSGEASTKKLMECALEYSLSDGSGVTASGSAIGRIDEEKVSIIPGMGEPILFSPREVLEFTEADYTIGLLLTSKERLTLSGLGHSFEDFSRILSAARNEVVLKDMLMQERLVLGGIKGVYEYCGKAGNCELRIYDAGLVIIVERGEPMRFPYGKIGGITEGDYMLTLTMADGERLTVSRLGGQYDPFKKALNGAMNNLSLRAQDLIKSVAPAIDSSMARRAARLLHDGRAAKKSDLDAISPAIWRGLEKKMEEIGVLDEYTYLASLAPQGQMRIGLERGLMGDFTGDYLWILIPVPASNAVILEAVSVAEGEKVEPLPSNAGGEEADAARASSEAENAGGRWATYVFNMGPNTDEMLERLNDCMLAINFRREPIFLSDADLELPRNIRYWYSVRKLPMLKELRGRFRGRIIHVSREQWQRGVREILNLPGKD